MGQLKNYKTVRVKSMGETFDIPGVEDEKWGYLEFNDRWLYKEEELTSEDARILILLLESPHREEFNESSQKGIGPARGKTGLNIKTYLHEIADATTELDENCKYCVWIVNAIQYQCSLFSHNKKIYDYPSRWKNLRDEVFDSLWKDGKESLRERLLEIIGKKDYMILNCVTHSVTKSICRKSIVQTFLSNDMKLSQVIEWPHPCSPWFYRKAR